MYSYFVPPCVSLRGLAEGEELILVEMTKRTQTALVFNTAADLVYCK